MVQGIKYSEKVPVLIHVTFYHMSQFSGADTKGMHGGRTYEERLIVALVLPKDRPHEEGRGDPHHDDHAENGDTQDVSRSELHVHHGRSPSHRFIVPIESLPDA